MAESCGELNLTERSADTVKILDNMAIAFPIVYIIQLTIALVLMLIVIVLYYRQSVGRQGGWRHMSASRMHKLNLMAAITLQISITVLMFIFRATGVFSGGIVVTTKNREHPWHIAYMCLDYISTLAFVYAPASIMYICVQSNRRVDVTHIPADKERMHAKYQLALLWALSFVIAVTFEWFYTNLMYHFFKQQFIFQILIDLINYGLPLSVITYTYVRMQRSMKIKLPSAPDSLQRGYLERQVAAERTMVLAKVYGGSCLLYYTIWTIVSFVDPCLVHQHIWLNVLIFMANFIFFFGQIAYAVAMVYINDSLWIALVDRFPVLRHIN